MHSVPIRRSYEQEAHTCNKKSSLYRSFKNIAIFVLFPEAATMYPIAKQLLNILTNRNEDYVYTYCRKKCNYPILLKKPIEINGV